MGSGDGGGVLVSPAPASMVPLTTAVGRLLEPELIALSSHGGHHLFINRIPPRLPKEDVEKIILAQLRLHPFVLQVSKCSVIPQNSLKNKGYGFITLDGSPSPSDLDAIADSLNNKLQVGCRTLGVRVCTDCHSACYGEDDGCASSSSRCSTPPNEPASFDLPDAQPRGAIELSSGNDLEAAAAVKGDVLGLAEQGSATASMMGALVPQADILQNAVTALVKQNVAGPASVAGPGLRRRKAARPDDPRLYSENGRYHLPQHQHSLQSQVYQGYGGQEGSRWRGGKGLNNGNSIAYTAGRQRLNIAESGPSTTGFGELVPRASRAPGVQAREGDVLEREEGIPGSCDLTHLLSQPVAPLESTAPFQQQQNDSVMKQEKEQSAVAPQNAGDCGVNGAMVSPRSISSYSSASGSVPGSTSNSAPGSVTGSGSRSASGQMSRSSVGGWCGGEDHADGRAVASPGPTPQELVGVSSAGTDAEIAAAADCVSDSYSFNGQSSSSRHHQPLQRQVQGTPQRPAIVNGVQGHSDVADDALASAPPHSPSKHQHPASGAMSLQQEQQQRIQQAAPPSQAQVQRRHVHTQPQQVSAQSFGFVARRSRSPTRESRSVPTVAMAEQISAGLQGHPGRGQVIAVQPPSAAQMQSTALSSTQQTSGIRSGVPAHSHLHSASAPTPSSRNLQQYHQQQVPAQGRHRSTVHRQQPKLMQGGPYAHMLVSSTGSGGDGIGGVSGTQRSGFGGGDFQAYGSTYTRLQRPCPVQIMDQSEMQASGYGCRREGTSSAWEGTENAVVEGPGINMDRRGSYPGGQSSTKQYVAIRSQPPPAQYRQPQQPQHQLVPPHQSPHHMPLTQQSRVVSYQSNGASGPGPQLLQQQQQLLAQAARLPAQQQASGLHFHPLPPPPSQQQQPTGLCFPQHPQQQFHPQEDVTSVGQSPYQHHQQLQLGREGQQPVKHPQPLPPHASQVQQQLPQGSLLHQLSQPQQSLCVQGFEAHAIGVPQPQLLPSTQMLSSSCVPPAATTTGSGLMKLKLQLMGNSEVGSDGYRLIDSAPNEASVPAGLVCWQMGSLDTDLRESRSGMGKPQLTTTALMETLTAAAATSMLKVPSADLPLGRSSSDEVQDPSAESTDSGDLDPLDLEPMILQLLENEDDDGYSGIGSRQLSAESSQQQYPHHHQHHLHYIQSNALQQQQPTLQHQVVGTSARLSVVPASATLQLSPLVAMPAAGADAYKYGHHQGQQLHHHHQQQQVGFTTRMAVGAAGGSSGGVTVAWAHTATKSYTDGGGSGHGVDTTASPGTATAGALPTSSLNRVAALSYSGAGMMPSGPVAGGALHAATAPLHEQLAAAPSPAVSAEQSWAMGRGDMGPLHPGVGTVGPDAYGGVGAGVAHRLGAGAGGSRAPPPVANGSFGSGSRGFGQRGSRHHAGRIHMAHASYGGGRGSGPRGGAMGTVGMGAVSGAGRKKGGGAGGFEAQSLVSGSLPNASLLAVMQRLNT
ncbi:hypothetical protein Vafri_12126 [Volvox africanus]|uniref:RRM domain-containing protein n=1 Tax=Volvox africanus TaxID=51714 RepID=A0A8J4B8Y0_9CHLO|nr:hypothetical protein Vafri_12126 [Volvox africanus]